MATWETTSPSTLWTVGGLFGFSPDKIVKITDDENDETLEVGDGVKLTFDGFSGTFDGSFLGTVTVNGVTYPVVEYNLGWYVVGLDDKKAPAMLARSELDTSGPFTVCYFPETLIATLSGERKVENIIAGDMVLIGDAAHRCGRRHGVEVPQNGGSARAVPVKWVGRQSVSTRFGPAERLMPVRFTAGSLGGGGGQTLLPHNDLTVTADHALLIDGVLCEAGALVNGTTITRVPLSEFGESYTVYHIETVAHEIILAKGTTAESFVDNVSRRAFDNYVEYEALHGVNPTEMKELPYPRASNAKHLPARIKRRLGIDGAKPVKIA